jgi:predicted AlkP superfamily pyrophosphatase or phosphodiesterase
VCVSKEEEVTSSTGRRAIVMVWDGLRPDYVTPELTPRLHDLASRGVRFTNSHAVFPTVTRCNAASIATGALPAEHGIPGNRFVARDIEPGTVFSSADHQHLERLRAARGRILSRATLSEAVAVSGRRAAVLGTGSPGSALLLHPEAAGRGDLLLHPVLWHGIPPADSASALGAIPDKARPNTEQNAYFTSLITDLLLPEYQPALITYWHTDPDHTQHAHGLGHSETLRSLRDADVNLGAILDALDLLGLAGETDVVITSDHGFSTITEPLPLLETLLESGVKREAESDDVLVADGQIYVRDHDPVITARVVEVLGAQESVGAIFTGANEAPVIPGTASLAEIGHGGELCPDVLISGAWSNARNEYGYAGTCAAGRGATRGLVATHGSASPWDIRNTLIFSGPSFKGGMASDVPAGNIDIAPTLRHTLGLTAARSSGRVLAEVLAEGQDPTAVDWDRHIETVELPDGLGQQRMHRSRVGHHVYLDYAEVERG